MVTLKLIAVITSLLNPAVSEEYIYNAEAFTDQARCEAVGKEQGAVLTEYLAKRGLIVDKDVKLEMKCVAEGKDA